MTPVRVVLTAFGGIRKTAKALGKSPATVWGWKKSGVIPSRSRVVILQIATENGLKVNGQSLTSHCLDFGMPDGPNGPMAIEPPGSHPQSHPPERTRIDFNAFIAQGAHK